MDYVSLIGTAVGVLGLVYAYVENRKRQRTTDYIRQHNWSSYQRANTTSALVQHAKAKYLDRHRDKLDPEIVELLGRADGFAQEVFKETIRQICYFEPSFRSSDFQRWKKEGKLTDDKVTLFRQLAVDPEFEGADQA